MPEARQRVVVNATPLIALSLIGKLNLLNQLYGEIMVPVAVESEVLSGGHHAIGKEDLAEAGWLKTVPLHDPRRADLLSDLDRGEAEVIALAQKQGADRGCRNQRSGTGHRRGRIGRGGDGGLSGHHRRLAPKGGKSGKAPGPKPGCSSDNRRSVGPVSRGSRVCVHHRRAQADGIAPQMVACRRERHVDVRRGSPFS